MLRLTKGMGHPSPPPSLASAVLGRASDGGGEGSILLNLTHTATWNRLDAKDSLVMSTRKAPSGILGQEKPVLLH
jgi:hypothetical protein